MSAAADLVLVPTRELDRQFARAGLWEDRTLGSFLDVDRTELAGRLAVVDGAVQLTYAELAERVDALAGALEDLGVTPGRPVLVQLPNWWEALVTYHAVARIGAVVNPVIPIYRHAELSFIVEQSRPAAIVVPGTFRGTDHAAMLQEVTDRVGHRAPIVVVRAPAIAGTTAFDDLVADRPAPPAAEARPDDIALLLYTSGTTAAPKGVLHSHQTLVYECRSILQRCGLGADDAVFMGSPVTHITGFLYGYAMPPMVGATSVLLDVWDPDVAADLIERHGCRFTVAATPFLKGLIETYEARGATSSLRAFGCGGADVPPELVRRAAKVIGDGVSRVYGSSEFPTYSFGLPGDRVEKRAETDGYPIGPVEARLDGAVDGVGELLVRGPELFHGYLDAALNADSFTDDGYFRTGDLASFDADGYLTIHGRKKDIIIRKGENISAREVEDQLFDHEKVLDVAVVALPDEERGELACAVVVTDDPALGLRDLQRHLEARGVAKQKWPERLQLVESLPRTASGKVQKFLIRERLLGPGG